MRDVLALQVRSNPDRTALVDAATDRAWTFREYDDAVAETAGRLAALGVESGDRVAVLLETRPAFARLAFACARLGAVLVPLNARLAVPELRAQAAAVDPVLVVCGADTERHALELGVPVTSVDAPDSGDVRAFGDVDPAGFDPVARSFSDTRALMFTSGTTGDPKAVELTDGNFAASAVASAFRLGVLPGDRWLCPLSTYHMGGLSVVLRSALYGTTAVLTRGFDAGRVLAALADYDCTGVSLVPTMLRRLLDAREEAEGLPGSLRFALVGGAPTPADLAERALAAGVPLCQTYGMTETASQVATLRPEEARDHRDTVGRPLLGTDVTVLGPDGDPLPQGEPGELVVSGPTVTPGYVDAPERDAARFCEYGLRTGDRGFVDDAGYLHVVGRQADRIITGGENVHPAEVADTLESHPAVAEAAVVGVPDEEWGELVGALVVRARGATVTADELRAYADDRLAGYKRPRVLAFADELPRTASGTVDREAVLQRLEGER